MNALLVSILCLVGGTREFQWSQTFASTRMPLHQWNGGKVGQHATLDPLGLRLQIPPDTTESGWHTPSGLEFWGDFEVTASLRVDELPGPAATGDGDAGVSLDLLVGANSIASLSLVRHAKGTLHIVAASNQAPGRGRLLGTPEVQVERIEEAEVLGKVLQVVITRSGGDAEYRLIVEEGTFSRTLARRTIQTVNLSQIRLWGWNHIAEGQLDARWLRIDVFADNIPGVSISVRTIDETVWLGEAVGLDRKSLVIESKSEKSVVPLRDVLKVDTGSSLPLVLVAIGQDNEDFVGPPEGLAEAEGAATATGDAGQAAARLANALVFGRARVGRPPRSGAGAANLPPVILTQPQPSGIQDIHVRVEPFDPELRIRQITLTTGGSDTETWHWNSAGIHTWSLYLVRPPGSETLDLYFEPRKESDKIQGYTVQIEYEDVFGNRKSVHATASGPFPTIDPKLAVVADAPKPSRTRFAMLFLTNGDWIRGELERMDAQGATIQIRVPGIEESARTLHIPRWLLAGVRLYAPHSTQTLAAFLDTLRSTPEADVLRAAGRDDAWLEITGKLVGLEFSRFRFEFEGMARNLRADRVDSIRLTRVEPENADSENDALTQVTLHFVDGQRLSGRLVSIQRDQWEIELPGNDRHSIPTSWFRSATFRDGRVAWLSDMEPTSVEQVGYFGRPLEYRRDKNLTGSPIQVAGRRLAKGISVHARTVLTYDLESSWDRLSLRVGFEDGSKPLGNAALRIIGDGRVLWENPRFVASSLPAELNLKVTGVRQLVLEADFGENEDIGDRIVWGNAKLVRDD